MWGDAFVKEVLNNGRWNRPWHFTFQGLGGPDPWVILHIELERSAVKVLLPESDLSL